ADARAAMTDSGCFVGRPADAPVDLTGCDRSRAAQLAYEPSSCACTTRPTPAEKWSRCRAQRDICSIFRVWFGSDRGGVAERGDVVPGDPRLQQHLLGVLAEFGGDLAGARRRLAESHG